MSLNSSHSDTYKITLLLARDCYLGSYMQSTAPRISLQNLAVLFVLIDPTAIAGVGYLLGHILLVYDPPTYSTSGWEAPALISGSILHLLPTGAQRTYTSDKINHFENGLANFFGDKNAS